MGLFVEVFYSPYDDEVMELYLGERYQTDKNEEQENQRKALDLNKYKSAKTIWVDLEPGEYTL